ncbi:hypothetical protein HDU87_002492, partial [Geranomyces variabilis]
MRPNGDESNFTESFVCIFDSHETASESASAHFSHGTFTEALNSSGDLTVTGSSQLQGGVQTGYLSALSTDSPLLRITSREKTHMTIGGNAVLFNTSVFPDPAAAGNTINIGSVDNPFHSANLSGNVSVTNQVDAGNLVIHNDAVIKGSLSLDTDLSVLSGLSTFLNIDIVGSGKISGPLAAKSITSDEISCSYLDTTGQISVAGPLVFTGSDDTTPSIRVHDDDGTQTLRIQATDIFLTDSSASGNAGIRIAADGTIRSLRDFAMSCGSGNTISLGDAATACVRIPAEHLLVDGRFFSLGEASFEDRVSVSGDVHLSGNLQVGGQLVFDSEVGQIAVTVPVSSSSSLIEFQANDRVCLCVPGIEKTDALLTLVSGGDVIIGGDGGIVCQGTGAFAKVVANTLQCDDVRVGDRISICSDSSEAVLTASVDGRFNITVGRQDAFQFTTETAAATFFGDLATGGKLTTLSLQVGERFNVHNDGSVTFSDVNDITAGRLEIVPPTGTQA